MSQTDSGGPATDVADRPAASQGGQDGTTGADGVKEQAAQAAGTAADEGRRVASVAGEEAQRVAAETKQQAQQVLDEARSMLGDQASAQRDKLVEVLGSVSDDLERMGSQAESGLAGDLVRTAAQQVRGLSGHLDGKQPADLLDDVRRFARNRPGTFLLGALAAGVVAGRVARSVQGAQGRPGGQRGDQSSSPSGAARTSLPQQRAAGASTPAPTSQLPSTPRSGAEADFPADRPGELP